MEHFTSGDKSRLLSDTKPNDNLPWVEKYRPASLDDVTGQDGVVATVRKFVASNQIPHLLFYGPPGTGKTSTIVAIAKEIYGQNYRNMVLELNASDDRGIDVVRNQIKTFASSRQIFAKGFKLVILDEADAMTNVAQNALRRIIEKYTSHTRFCILANYTHKLNPALLSRCMRFRFSPLSNEAVAKRVDHVIHAEHINISPEAKSALVELSKGDMRRALNVLQACHASVNPGSTIEELTIYDCIGSPFPGDIRAIMDSMMGSDWIKIMQDIQHIKVSKGLALADILTCLVAEFDKLELKPRVRMQLLDGLSQIEYRLSSGCNEKIQTSAMIGVVKGSLEAQA